MSIEADDNAEHETSLEDLLKEMILHLKILIRHNEKLNGEIYTIEDLDDDHN